MQKKYRLAAVGGTFDHFHIGHEHLLNTAFSLADQVVIGLTKPNLFQHKILANQIELYTKRKHNLLEYLKRTHLLKHTIIVPLFDPFGPALTDPKINVLVCSRQTLDGAQALNRSRQKNHLQSLPIVTADMVLDDQGEHLSSTAIRLGAISSTGKTYSRCLNHGLTINASQRLYFQKPHGPIVTHLPLTLVEVTRKRGLPVIAVGDQVIQSFQEHRLSLTHLIYDAHIGRQPVKPDYLSPYPYPVISVTNSAGQITLPAINALKRALRLPQCVVAVAGEEDLLAVPALLTAPLNSLILYGQPGRGLVVMSVTTAKKMAVASFIEKSRLDN